MTAQFPLYLIPLLPLLGATIALVIGYRWGKSAITLICCGSVGAAFVVAIKAALSLHGEEAPSALVSTFFSAPWIKSGDLPLSAGRALDRPSALLPLVGRGLGFLTHVFPTAYMEDDP